MYYSAVTNTFYPAELKREYGNSWPLDAVKVTCEEWKEYGLGCPPTDKIRGSLGGRPAWVKKPASSPSVLIDEERYWRNSELLRADFELNKIQDLDSKAVDSIIDWRDYRKSLRQWPEHIDFPKKAHRPASPDYKE